VTYTLQDEGEYTLPAVAISWWDPEQSVLRTARVPPISFSVAPNPELTSHLEALQGVAFGEAKRDSWSGAVLAGAAARARKQHRRQTPASAAGLPGLNPSC